MKIEVNDSDFNQEVLKADRPCLVDFWAEWYAPCQFIGKRSIKSIFTRGMNLCHDGFLKYYAGGGTAE